MVPTCAASRAALMTGVLAGSQLSCRLPVLGGTGCSGHRHLQYPFLRPTVAKPCRWEKSSIVPWTTLMAGLSPRASMSVNALLAYGESVASSGELSVNAETQSRSTGRISGRGGQGVCRRPVVCRSCNRGPESVQGKHSTIF